MLKRILNAFKPTPRPAGDAPSTQLQMARMHFEDGEFEQAERLFRSALAADADNPAIGLELTLALEKLGRLTEAARLAVSAMDANLDAANGIALRIFDRLGLGDPDSDAQGGPADFATLFALGNRSLQSGDFPAALEYLTRSLALHDLPFTRQRLGCVAALSGDFELADAHFLSAGERGFAPDEYIRLGEQFLSALDTATCAGGFAEPAADADAVIFAACDPVYFRRFAHALLESLRINAGARLIVHLHLFNPDQWIEEELASLPSGGWLARLQTSREVVRAGSADEAKTHYSCARLFCIPELLARHGLPVIMVDMDVLLLGRLTELIELVRSHDVGVLRWAGPQWRIWDLDSASTVAFAPSTAGVRFATMVAAYARTFLGRPGGAWFLDQIALFASRTRLDGRGVRVGAIDPDWYALWDRDGEAIPPRAMFWSVTANIAKHAPALESELFGQYLPKIRRAFGWTLPGQDTFFSAVLARAPTEDGRRRWDFELMQMCARQARSRRRALDIGAHVGFWSEWLAREFSQVDAFEPHALMRQCFAANVMHANVTLHSCGLGDSDRRVAMNFNPVNSGMTHVGADAPDGEQIRTLDGFGFDDVDFVKIDTEGYEISVLRGAEATLRRCRPLILIEEFDEYLTRYGEAGDSALRLVQQFGARIVAELPDNNFLFDWADVHESTIR